MGVPGFFKWLLIRHKRAVKSTLHPGIDHLYLDANCLLHPVCFQVVKENPDWKNIDELERKMIAKIIEYLNFVIAFANPSKTVYIAIDGVAPMSKIKHQRLRRFKSVLEHEKVREIKDRYGVKDANFWSNASITPGTMFMSKITAGIEQHIASTLSERPYEVTFSTAQTPGEGEHKIMEHIRASAHQDSIAVYGLDADLIFLTLASQRSSLYLLRESREFGKSDPDSPFTWVSIDRVRRCVESTFTGLGITHNNVISDFIFLCYLLGNDFLPHLPGLSIHDGGIETVLNKYRDAYQGAPLLRSDTVEIDFEFLTRLFSALATDEYILVQGQYKRSKRRHHPPVGLTPVETELWNLENLNFPINDPIRLGTDHPLRWKHRYYCHYMGENTAAIRHRMCQRYIEGLVWVANYYFRGCPSWTWFYEFDAAPFISDIRHFLEEKKLRKINFKLGRPVQPIVQLMMVLPPSLAFLVYPKKLRILMHDGDLRDFYPPQFDIDILYKRKHWEAMPLRLRPLDPRLFTLSINAQKKKIRSKHDLAYLDQINRVVEDHVFTKA